MSATKTLSGPGGLNATPAAASAVAKTPQRPAAPQQNWKNAALIGLALAVLVLGYRAADNYDHEHAITDDD